MDRLAGVGDPELRAAFAYALAEAHPVTADDLAGAHGLHRNVARSRLERLAETGLLSRGYERRTGRSGPGAGRPAKTYSVAPHLRSIEFPQRHFEKIVALLVDTLPKRTRRRRLRDVGLAFADEIPRRGRLRPAKTPAAAAERISGLAGSLGFQTTVTEVTTDRVVLETPMCPLRPLVRENDEAAEIDRGMWTGLCAHALEDVDPGQIECETHHCSEDGTCRIELRLKG